MSAPALSIGDFARATHMSVKMLRHYHEIGLLAPADVDPGTGYRRYTADQIPTAQVIRRFRDVDMPLDQIRAVLAAEDPATRSELISEHLDALQTTLAETQAAVSSLRDLLASPELSGASGICFRSVTEMTAAAIIDTVDAEGLGPWFQGAMGELRATLAAHNMSPASSAGGVFDDELFTHERGRAMLFIPCAGEIRPTGRVVSTVVPAVELATIIHPGSHQEVDRSYGALADYVARHALAVDGPIREYYLVGRHDTSDDSAWRTEIGWPIFNTGAAD
jgi:DNA-binding transcriptional MerR regulator